VAERRGMGRGLAAILPDPVDAAPQLREIPVEMIRPNPNQPRTTFEPGALRGLADSIGTTGVVQPLLVRPLADGRYELIAGERRWRAAQEAGLRAVPAVVRDEAQAERLQTALVENMVREDLNPVDAARACAQLLDELGLNKEELAKRVGRSRAAISNLVRLLDLPDQVLELLESGRLSEGHGRAILQAKGNEERKRLAREAAAHGWSVRETEERAKATAQKPPARRAARGLSAQEREAIHEAEDTLAAALGTDVRVRAGATGIKAELHFEDLDELAALAKRLSR
jgi:ParB family transcriptional regulator, chromosome partitioning protein